MQYEDERRDGSGFAIARGRPLALTSRADPMGRQKEDAPAIAVWGNEGGQHADWRDEGRAPAAPRAPVMPPGLPRSAIVSANLPPLMHAVRPTEHQFDALVLPWSWCRCCQRAFIKGTFRRLRLAGTARHPHPRVVQLCPYQDCWGEISHDSRPWASIRQVQAGDPEQPERHVIYPHQSHGHA
ncbi:MAG: hypothetical protein HGA45_23265 [Chloroflexales bacterium]|nr:hypothetical protein [Chloroflexales bacterium]